MCSACDKVIDVSGMGESAIKSHIKVRNTNNSQQRENVIRI
jgi:hypothetical protein